MKPERCSDSNRNREAGVATEPADEQARVEAHKQKIMRDRFPVELSDHGTIPRALRLASKTDRLEIEFPPRPNLRLDK